MKREPTACAMRVPVAWSLDQAGGVMANDEGEYRIFGLPAGTYVVSTLLSAPRNVLANGTVINSRVTHISAGTSPTTSASDATAELITGVPQAIASMATLPNGSRKIVGAKTAVARAMRAACTAGRLAYLAGRIPKKLYATASSPEVGTIAPKPR
jgi:hypothetical protein